MGTSLWIQLCGWVGSIWARQPLRLLVRKIVGVSARVEEKCVVTTLGLARLELIRSVII